MSGNFYLWRAQATFFCFFFFCEPTDESESGRKRKRESWSRVWLMTPAPVSRMWLVIHQKPIDICFFPLCVKVNLRFSGGHHSIRWSKGWHRTERWLTRRWKAFCVFTLRELELLKTSTTLTKVRKIQFIVFRIVFVPLKSKISPYLLFIGFAAYHGHSVLFTPNSLFRITNWFRLLLTDRNRLLRLNFWIEFFMKDITFTKVI